MTHECCPPSRHRHWTQWSRVLRPRAGRGGVSGGRHGRPLEPLLDELGGPLRALGHRRRRGRPQVLGDQCLEHAGPPAPWVFTSAAVVSPLPACCGTTGALGSRRRRFSGALGRLGTLAGAAGRITSRPLLSPPTRRRARWRSSRPPPPDVAACGPSAPPRPCARALAALALSRAICDFSSGRL